MAINAISLVAALIANASLLLNMARRLRFSIAQPVTIAGFMLAAILLIADMAALTASPTYRLTEAANPLALPAGHHALSSAFYYAIFAAAIYVIISVLMCLTVYGANAGHYEKEFRLTASQRTLMLQTMSFVTYLLLGALVFSHVEEWEFLDAVYWADVTLLTVGIGDYSPATHTGRSLLFPFAIGGILIIGLVIGSIRSLVLERGKEKLSARITEKKRSTAVNSIDDHKKTIRVSWFNKVEFDGSNMAPFEMREKEFAVMRKVQDAAETQRRWMALAISAAMGAALWFVGAAIFMVCERNQSWTYFGALYFSYTSLLTIGYGDYQPMSNSGKPFFVIWSIMAVPALTILISNMGDTIVKLVSDATIWLGSLTVLPGDAGVRESAKAAWQRIRKRKGVQITAPGIFGDATREAEPEDSARKRDEERMLDRIADRMTTHLAQEELNEAAEAEEHGDELERDIHFYHYVLARETRAVMKDLSASPPKQYEWGEWEYFLKLMGNEDDPVDYKGQTQPDILVPEALRIASSDETEAPTDEKHPAKDHGKSAVDDGSDFTWLSNKSPLMGTKSESEWILERLSAALERELNRQRKGLKRPPPISMRDLQRRRSEGRLKSSQSGGSGSETETETRALRDRTGVKGKVSGK